MYPFSRMGGPLARTYSIRPFVRASHCRSAERNHTAKGTSQQSYSYGGSRFYYKSKHSGLSSVERYKGTNAAKNLYFYKTWIMVFIGIHFTQKKMLNKFSHGTNTSCYLSQDEIVNSTGDAPLYVLL